MAPESTLDTILMMLNASAGYYAAVMWSFFGVVRIRGELWWRVFLNFALAGCATLIGTYFLLVGLGAIESAYLFDTVRWIVSPLLFLPALLAYLQWRQAQELIERAHQIESGVETLSGDDS